MGRSSAWTASSKSRASAPSMVTSAAVFDPSDCGPFRVIYAQGVELLTDEVSQYASAKAPFTLA